MIPYKDDPEIYSNGLAAITNVFINATEKKISQMNKIDFDYIKATDTAHDYLYRFESFEHMQIQELVLLDRHLNLKMNEYSYLLRHSYSSYDELKSAAGPQVNQRKCIKHLKELVARMHLQPNLKDLNFNQLLDTFGHAPSGKMLGNYIWPGSYRECRRLRILRSGGGDLGTRYCIAQLKGTAWPSEVETDFISVQVGVCLPETCDSISYRDKHSLVGELMSYNSRALDQEMYEVASLYCLPDEASPLRSVWRDRSTTLVLLFVTCWMGLIIYASVKHFLRDYHLKQVGSEQDSNSRGSLKLLESLSITRNVSKLFEIEEPQECDSNVVPNKQTSSSEDKAYEDQNLHRDTGKNRASTRNSSQNFINFDILSSIKVIAMCYVILGHVLMIITGGLIDARQLKTNTAFLIANLTPAFAVNSFFSITGILTAYLLLKRNQTSPFLTNPLKWALLMAYRYARIMPFYLLIVLYSKLLAKYTNSGPFWDYGTSKMSHRRQCEQESILWTILFAANFKQPLEHCLPGGWYLANDFQFFLITPLFIYLLGKHPKLGRRALLVCAAGGYLSAIISVLNAQVDDMRPLVQFDPHAFKVYVTSLVYTYTRPYYRMPAYLSGLYIGHILFEYELAKSRSSTVDRQINEDNRSDKERDWPDTIKNHCKLICSLGIAVSLAFVGSNIHLGQGASSVFSAITSGTYFFVFALSLDLVLSFKATKSRNGEELGQPALFKRFSGLLSLTLLYGPYITTFIGSRISATKSVARVTIAMILPTYNLAVGVAVGMIVLSAATSPTNKPKSLIFRFFTAPQWKPLARLSLCVLLVNVEVITYITDGREYLHAITNQYLWSINLLAIVMTYIVSTVASVIVESPVRCLIKHALKFIAERSNSNLSLKTS